MKKSITINEEALRQIIEQVINEKFENNTLASMIQQHGGLSEHDFLDMRNSHNTKHDVRTAKPKGYIPLKLVSKLVKLFDWNEPLRNQILWCKDGGLIVIDTNNFKDDFAYMDKLFDRDRKFAKENNAETYGNSLNVNFDRKKAHEKRNNHNED